MRKTFWKSEHKLEYIIIAVKHFTTPWHVFNLAHGYERVHQKDAKIMHDLKEIGIVHHRHSKNHHSEK